MREKEIGEYYCNRLIQNMKEDKWIQLVRLNSNFLWNW